MNERNYIDNLINWKHDWYSARFSHISVMCHSSPTEGDNFISVCHSTKFCQLQTPSCFLAIMAGSHNISPVFFYSCSLLSRKEMLFVYHLLTYCVWMSPDQSLTWPAWSPGYNVVVSQWPPGEIKIKMGRSGYTALTSLHSPLSTDHITVTVEQTATLHHSCIHPGQAGLG